RVRTSGPPCRCTRTARMWSCPSRSAVSGWSRVVQPDDRLVPTDEAGLLRAGDEPDGAGHRRHVRLAAQVVVADGEQFLVAGEDDLVPAVDTGQAQAVDAHTVHRAAADAVDGDQRCLDVVEIAAVGHPELAGEF